MRPLSAWEHVKTIIPILKLPTRPLIRTTIALFAGVLLLGAWLQRTEIVILLATLALLFVVILYAYQTLIAQDIELREQIAKSNKLALENEAVRHEAGLIRSSSNEAEEQLLARIGADLHDGPIQLISLLILKLSAGGTNRETQAQTDGTPNTTLAIAQSVHDELRSISAGLNLPEIENLSMSETIERSIVRHEELTGTAVIRDINVPQVTASSDIRVCVYRVIQESLTNAQKHAAGATKTVTVRQDKGMLKLTVCNDDLSIAQDKQDIRAGASIEKASLAKISLGLSGIRNRVEAFKGSFRFDSTLGKRTCVIVELPLTSRDENKL
ncbi:MAG: sensor histidine kinase [Rhizobiaceae bacterium]